MLQPPQRHGALAARAAARRKAHGTPLLVPHPDDRYLPFPLSDMQQAYWIGRSGDLQGGGVAMQSCVDLDCPALFTDRFEKALNALVERHDMLHAVVTEDGRQRVLPLPVHFPLTISDLSDLDPREQEQRLAASAQRQAQTVSDLGSWPQSEVHFSLLGHNADGSKRGVLHFRWDMWATDGRSFQILYEDLAALYLDPDAKLPPLPITFRDYQLALRELEGSDAYQKSLGFWREQLANLPAAPVFPNPPSARHAEEPLGIKRYADVLTMEETAFLEQECRTRGLSLTAVLASLYSEVLGLWSATRSFTLNMPRFNRNLHWHEALNHVMGEFATFTLVPVDLEAGSTLAERARALQETLWNALEHGEVSGVRLLRELARARGELAAEAMPVVFTAMPARKGSDRGVEQVLRAFGSVRATHGSTPQTTLDCQYTLFNDCLHIYWDARTQSFPAGMTDAMFAEFMRVVRLAARDAAAWSAPSLAAVPADQLAVRARRNARPLALPDKRPCQLFVERALEDPDAPAVAYGDLVLSYGELLGHALAVRTGLLAALAGQDGMDDKDGKDGRESLAGQEGTKNQEKQESPSPRPRSVALVLQRGWQAIACLLGVQLAGLPYLPLDCANPGERLHTMLRTGRAALVITDAAGRTGLCADTLAADGIGHMPAEDLCGRPGSKGRVRGPAQALAQDLATTAPGPGDAAYIILTSGTTGTPKAVVVGQQGLLNVCAGTNSLLSLGRGDRVLGITALHHDLSVYDVFGTLTSGACLVLLPHEQAQDPDAWIDCLLRHKVTLWNSVPAFLKALATRCEERSVRLPVRVFLTGGDWVETSLPARLKALAPGCAFYSVGGPTETTVWNILYRVEEELPAGWSVIPYGAATENNSYYLLDSRLCEVPDWVTGEMYCAGVNVCLDIWAQDDVQRFYVHPRTGERLYRTGDMGRFHPDGLIEIMGRADFQINIGGYRLDPAEIETALQRHPAVECAVVVPVGQDRGTSGRVLGAFILPRGRETIAGRKARQPSQARQAEEALEQELTRFLEERLPAQMIPRVWRLVAALPLTANGKVDRKALVKEAGTLVAPRAEDADRPPRTPLEKLLSALWEEVLGCPVPGARTNFFRLGGDSLKAVQILTRLKEQLPLSLPLQAFFATPTIEGLAGTLIARISAGMRTSPQENA